MHVNLYIIKRPADNVDWEEWIAAVVAAESESAARLIHPSGDDFYDASSWSPAWHERTGYQAFGGWIAPHEVVVEFLAVASPSQRAGVVLGANRGS